MDLSKCIDTLDHDLIIRCVKRRITDGSILGLIKPFLKRGIMIGLTSEYSDIGSPQGGVIVRYYRTST
jgi:RNA-directed DNA polymerase